jgi:hypothetical protein
LLPIGRSTLSTDTPAAVLYVCVQNSRNAPGLAEQRAVEEGHSFADKRQMRFVAEVTDPYGKPTPQKREGWLRIREMAERAEMTSLITRWPNSISPQHELRYPEIAWLKDRGVSMLFSWAPLAVLGGEDK